MKTTLEVRARLQGIKFMKSPVYGLRFKPIIALFLGLMVVSHANAGWIVCEDTQPFVGGPDNNPQNASSAINPVGSSPIIKTSDCDCGPYDGNDSNGDLTAATGGYGYDLNDGLNEGWILYNKYDVDKDKYTKQNTTLDVKVDSGGKTGTFSFDPNMDDTSYLIVLKYDGVFASFLSPTDTGGNDWGWNTDYDGNGKYANSHLSVYYRESFIPQQGVPVPGTLALLGLPMLGLGWFRRRRR